MYSLSVFDEFSISLPLKSEGKDTVPTALIQKDMAAKKEERIIVKIISWFRRKMTW